MLSQNLTETSHKMIKPEHLNPAMLTPEVSYYRRRVSSTPRLCREVEKQRRVLKRRTWCDKENTPMVLDLENNLQWEHASPQMPNSARNASKFKDFSMLKQCKSVKKILKEKVNSIKRSSSLYRKRCFSETVGNGNNNKSPADNMTDQKDLNINSCSSEYDSVDVYNNSVKKIKLQQAHHHNVSHEYEYMSSYTPLRQVDRCSVVTPSTHNNRPVSAVNQHMAAHQNNLPAGFSEPVMYRTRVRTNGSLHRLQRPRPIKLYPHQNNGNTVLHNNHHCSDNDRQSKISPIQEIPESFKCLPMIPFLESPSFPISPRLLPASPTEQQTAEDETAAAAATPKRSVRFQFAAAANEARLLECTESLDSLISQARQELMRERVTPVSKTIMRPVLKRCQPLPSTPLQGGFNDSSRADDYLDMHFSSPMLPPKPELKSNDSVYIDMNTFCK